MKVEQASYSTCSLELSFYLALDFNFFALLKYLFRWLVSLENIHFNDAYFNAGIYLTSYHPRYYLNHALKLPVDDKNLDFLVIISFFTCLF